MLSRNVRVHFLFKGRDHVAQLKLALFEAGDQQVVGERRQGGAERIVADVALVSASRYHSCV